ncbi:MAG: hypothetical protein H0U56_02850 [Methylibium sp.]|uniref:hypothetical protein n=1 Tax=Methylibium sp. TaxID=2067992 RepID=UPI00178D53F2|nr:hypothetical protein [Methylibium sp.]MBA2721840.1 hypothetical protein [Methylibium sp.]MBA3591493.1 hypothetical protein [Methylibium sp.]
MNPVTRARARSGGLAVGILWALAGCGGGSDSDPPSAAAPAQNTPTAQQIASSQQALDATAGPSISGSPTAADIAAAQLALDGNTTSGTADIAQTQAAMDASAPLVP